MNSSIKERQRVTFSLIFQNAKIVDGTGKPAFMGDVGVEGNRIAAIAAPRTLKGDVVLDVSARVLCPGFIDIHSHADFTLLVDGRAQSYILQGVTSVVPGNCGGGIPPITERLRELVKMNTGGWSSDRDIPVNWSSFGEYLEQLRNRGVSVNIFPLVGHGALRLAVAGNSHRACTREEINIMRSLASEAMAQGAVGFSTGLEYLPGIAADLAEIARIAEPVGEYGGIYATHCRNRAETMVEAAKEAVAIAEHSGTRLQLSHFVKRPWAPEGVEKRAKEVLDRASERGVITRFDIFPFDFGPTPLSYLMPPWSREGSREDIAERLNNEKVRRDILNDLRENFVAAVRSGIAEGMYIAEDGHNGELVGKTLGQVAKSNGVSVQEAAVWILARAGVDFNSVKILERWVERDDLFRALSDPEFFIMSDGISGALDGPLFGHAMSLSDWGYVPEFLGRFVRNMGIVSLEAAINRMTCGPADQLGLWTRGRITENCFGDIVVFNPDTISTDITPCHLFSVPKGIDHVLVNGEFVVENGAPTGAKPGVVGRGK
jgi:N-acyl-D-amino-acid deacylase